MSSSSSSSTSTSTLTEKFSVSLLLRLGWWMLVAGVFIQRSSGTVQEATRLEVFGPQTGGGRGVGVWSVRPVSSLHPAGLGGRTLTDFSLTGLYLRSVSNSYGLYFAIVELSRLVIKGGQVQLSLHHRDQLHSASHPIATRTAFVVIIIILKRLEPVDGRLEAGGL
ncbi:hypothetical protein EYF80_022449 [Liparis tanakae]|uniref:Uncharacterized protein n=1 Tax=Liparis tanakae TaxID=230148 RepID=A0A4Z2HRC6_9TELE|nr:hypothetical protein EYF80_022449 [Liparis tanakae]